MILVTMLTCPFFFRSPCSVFEDNKKRQGCFVRRHFYENTPHSIDHFIETGISINKNIRL